MENVFLFTGENGYTLSEELSRWTREFRERHGEENLTRLSAAGLTPSVFLNEVASSPFIAERRLIVVDGIPSFSQEVVPASRHKASKSALGMREVLAQVHPQVIVLFVAPKPDRRLTSTKELLELATVRTFTPLSGESLLQWMQEAFRAAGARAEAQVPALLVECVGEDQRSLSQEIDKLALFATDRTVTCSDVDALVFPSAEQTVWHLLDLLGEGHAEEAVLYCRRLLMSGESAQSIWNIFLWIVSSLVSVASAVSEGTVSIQSIMQETGVKFGAARSLLPLARACKKEQLKNLLLRVTEAEINLKTGVWKAGADSEEELFALLDRCLLSFPGSRRS
ncbi:MAG: DNA polymerase III subunit delta [Candidatus Peribacteraceae bacterium]|nr:DNA polymerase III subunit delta [Candidatus Peribacteraceae bacterium]MDD5742661.1 DNA polymerase III subunit delta [Candidatus Peribacteraceae bacterium]